MYYSNTTLDNNSYEIKIDDNSDFIRHNIISAYLILSVCDSYQLIIPPTVIKYTYSIKKSIT